MSFAFVDPSNLKDFVHDSDEYMRPFYVELAEIERLSRGKPGRIPKGKPRVTDGTLAGATRETPKRIIQQLPTGKVSIKKFPELEPYVNAILADEILLNANSGGTPYSKIKKSIKDTMRNGSSWAYVFYNRRGDWFGADFRRVYVKDIGFEKGKISEFDSNVMKMTGWYTLMDLKAIMYYQQQLKKNNDSYEGGWDLKVLQALIDSGVEEKDDEHKTEEEKKKSAGTNGYIKIEHVMQIGVGASFYSYSPKLDKVARTCVTKDPRGIIPLHGLVPEEDDSTPIGEPLLSLSVGKQNLLDFDMQMYQYNRGLLLSPPVKKWGNVPSSAIRLQPDAVINMGGPKGGPNDIETLDIDNSAISDYRNNASYIKTQIYNEQGSNSDSSVSSDVGSVGYSKTDRGVAQQEAKVGVNDNDLRKSTEGWIGRVLETALNLHFAESKGKRELDLKKETIKRLRLDPKKAKTMNYDQEFGPIKFEVSAGTTETSDSKQENQELTGLLEVTKDYGGLRPDRQMAVINQIIKNSGVDDPEDLLYADDEIEAAKNAAMQPQGAQAAQQQQMEQMQQKLQELQQKLQEEQQVPYKDAPESIKRQKEERAGYQPATDPSPTQLALDNKETETTLKAHQAHLQGVTAAHSITSNAMSQNTQPESPAQETPTEQKSEPQEEPQSPQQGLNEDEQQTIQLLKQRGIPDEDIATALTMHRNNYSDQDIAQVLMGGQSNG